MLCYFLNLSCSYFLTKMKLETQTYKAEMITSHTDSILEL